LADYLRTFFVVDSIVLNNERKSKVFTIWVALLGEGNFSHAEFRVISSAITSKLTIPQATTLSLYSVRLSPDQQQITEVKNARRLETHFRSPQLDLSKVTR
jgi:hypothetical protein